MSEGPPHPGHQTIAQLDIHWFR